MITGGAKIVLRQPVSYLRALGSADGVLQALSILRGAAAKCCTGQSYATASQ